MIEQGTHDYLAAQRREAQLTLPELEALTPMRRQADGALMPEKLVARGDAGWEFDVDRDSAMAARLATLVKVMDGICADIVSGEINADAATARHLARQWQAIREITQGNQPEGGK